MLHESSRPLVEDHDLVMFDLDGVVYVSGHAVEGAAEAIEQVRACGRHVAFVTNNASRTPDKVAGHLIELGVNAHADDVVTSAQAAATLLADRFDAGAHVLVLGADGLMQALAEAGLVPIPAGQAGQDNTGHDGIGHDEAVAVVSGYGPDVVWKDLMRAAVRIKDGLPWVASNTDLSIPTDYGIAPGHGVQVRMLQDFTGVEPVVAGKPSRPLLDETIARVGGERPLMVGDRLDTDIAGAAQVQVASLLVLTGVTDLDALIAALADERPTYLHPTLQGLHEPHPEVRADDQGAASAGGWTARCEGDRLVVDGEGSAADWWRAVAVAAWAHLDVHGDVVDVAGLQPPGHGAG